jgi:Xaa-Pro aminopeptidase
MTMPSFDFKARWARAASSMQGHGIDALFVMKPANLAYLTGDGRPCALGLLTRNLRCIVAVPASDVRSVRMASAATEIRAFGSEEEMFHGFSDVLTEQGLSKATIAVEKNFFDAALYDVFKAHILPEARAARGFLPASGRSREALLRDLPCGAAPSARLARLLAGRCPRGRTGPSS